MKNKAELTALKEEAETESKKLHELTEEELAQVSGGFTDNGNGTYNISYGETFYDGKMSFTPTETKLNVTENDHIQCDWFRVDSSGNLKDYGHCTVDVHTLLVCVGIN